MLLVLVIVDYIDPAIAATSDELRFTTDLIPQSAPRDVSSERKQRRGVACIAYLYNIFLLLEFGVEGG
jgi:hypothetical protein